MSKRYRVTFEFTGSVFNETEASGPILISDDQSLPGYTPLPKGTEVEEIDPPWRPTAGGSARVVRISGPSILAHVIAIYRSYAWVEQLEGDYKGVRAEVLLESLVKP